MTSFKVEFENRHYTTFLDNSEVTEDRVEVKVTMYSTAYLVWKDRKTGEWHNHVSKFELSAGLLKALGETLNEMLKV
jgi:hypothetical protein